jgi:hypothetical protein
MESLLHGKRMVSCQRNVGQRASAFDALHSSTAGRRCSWAYGRAVFCHLTSLTANTPPNELAANRDLRNTVRRAEWLANFSAWL